MAKYKPNNLDFNDGLCGAYTEIPNQGEMLKIFAFRANYEIDIFNLNSHQEAIKFLINKLEADIAVLRTRVLDEAPKNATSIDELIARLHALKKAGHTDVYMYKPYPSDYGYGLAPIKFIEFPTDEEHRKDNPDLNLPDSLLMIETE